MNRFLKYLLFGALCLITFPKVSFAAALTCTSGADAGNLMCTCDTGTQTIEASSGDVFTEQSCNDACHTLDATSWLLESCEGVDGAGDPILSTINNEDVVAPPTAPITQDADFIVPLLNVQIPGLSGLSKPTKIGDSTSVNFLAEYINALYSWALPAGALVAVVMMMLGGLQYVLSRGKSKYIEKAKTRITNAITGLVLLLAAYEIAFLIDPNTVRLKSLEVRSVDMVEWVQDSGDTPGAGATPDATSVASISPNIICDGTSPLYDIATSTIGHVTYRLGGKYGGSPPYVDGITKKDANGVLYKTYCPENQLCLDCSGYNDFLRKCGGLGDGGESGGTAGIFSGPNAAIITGPYTDTTVNGAALIPGDLIGFPTVTVNGKEKIGHVVMYVGNGKIAQSHAGDGRKEGKAIRVSSTSEFIDQMVADGRTAYVRHR